MPSLEHVIQHLWQPDAEGGPRRVYAILDAARNESIYPTLTTSQSNYCCLYRGEIPRVLAQAAPYLVHLMPDEPFTSWLISEGWGDSWGIFLTSAENLETLRRHFRRFLMVQDETGQSIYFRYYDPRVLRVYLPTCNAGELLTIFGPVGSFLVEGEEENTMLEYSCADLKLEVQTMTTW